MFENITEEAKAHRQCPPTVRRPKDIMNVWHRRVEGQESLRGIIGRRNRRTQMGILAHILHINQLAKRVGDPIHLSAVGKTII